MLVVQRRSTSCHLTNAGGPAARCLQADRWP
jgi:hypothetical protein